MYPCLELKSFVLLILLTFEARTETIKIVINHWNDVSGQLESFEPGTSNSSSAPVPCKTSTCVGGLANMIHWIYEKDENCKDVIDGHILRFSSGNLIGGESGWLSSKSNSWEEYGKLVNEHFNPTAMALGMKEFGAGLAQTNQYVKLNVPIAPPGPGIMEEKILSATLANTCNGQPTSGEESRFCSNVPKLQSVIISKFDVTNYTIGVIGFVNPTVEQLSLPGNLKFGPIVESINKVVNDNPNIHTFIALGDGTLEYAKAILDAISQVKLVIYGMGFGNSKIMADDYPMPYKDRFIATAGRYGSSIGKLCMGLDTETGNLLKLSGKLVVTNTPPKLNTKGVMASETFDKWKESVDDDKKSKVGETRVTLQGGELCWRQECNLGNLVADSMVHCALNASEESLNFPLHSIWHGGALFEDEVPATAKISNFDIHKWLPYHNRAHLVKILGSNLRRIFEASAGGINPTAAGVPDWRQFLQVSNGLEVYYDTRHGGPKLTRVRIAHHEGGVPKLGDLQNDNEYYLVIPTFLRQSRGVYNFTNDFWTDVSNTSNIGFDDVCLRNYINALGHITVGLEERIWIDEDPADRPSCDDNCKGSNTAVTVILTIVFFSIFLAILYVGYKYVLPRLQNRTSESYPRNQA